jgi:hypothetical protein
MDQRGRQARRRRFQHRSRGGGPPAFASGPLLFPPEDHAACPARIEAITAVLRAGRRTRALLAPAAAALPPSVGLTRAGERAGTSYDAPHVRFAHEHPANGTGWLIATGGTAVRLRPAGLHALLGGAGTAVILALMHVAGGLASLQALALLPGLAATLALTSAGAHALMKRRLAGCRLTERLAETSPGATVRLVGTISAQETVPSLFARRPTVLCRSRLVLADETRGIDFWLETAASERVRVHIRNALMLDRPQRLLVGQPVSGAHEVALCPGDQIELCGQLHRHADPAGQAAPGRGTPLGWSLRAPRGGFLLVQRRK